MDEVIEWASEQVFNGCEVVPWLATQPVLILLYDRHRQKGDVGWLRGARAVEGYYQQPHRADAEAEQRGHHKGAHHMQCQRCQGCMVADVFLDVMNVSGEMAFNGWRCVNCGDILDPVIAHHRHAPMQEVARPKRRWSGLRSRVSYLIVKDTGGY